jgi:hypothetical protein
MYVHGVDGARQTEMHTAESVALEPSAFVIQMPVEKMRIYELHVLVK